MRYRRENRIHRKCVSVCIFAVTNLLPESGGPCSSVIHALDEPDDGGNEDATDDDDAANAGKMRESSASTAGVEYNAGDEADDGDAPKTLIGCPNSGATCAAAATDEPVLPVLLL